eukprot:2720201-Pleurochrysis_carterae.AAC.2
MKLGRVQQQGGGRRGLIRKVEQQESYGVADGGQSDERRVEVAYKEGGRATQEGKGGVTTAENVERRHASGMRRLVDESLDFVLGHRSGGGGGERAVHGLQGGGSRTQHHGEEGSWS